MDDPRDPGPLNFSVVGPAAEPSKPRPEPIADEASAIPAPQIEPTTPPAPTATPQPTTWSIREPSTPPPGPLSGLPQLPVTPPPPPPNAPPFLEVRPDGTLADPRSTVSSRTAIAVVLTTLLIAVAGVVGLAMRPGATRTAAASTTPPAITETVATTPTAGFDRAAAGQKYLAAVGLANQAQGQINNLLTEDMSKPCTCPAGEFNPSDAVAYLPTFNQLMVQSATQLNALAATLPLQTRADVTAVSVSLTEIKDEVDKLFSTTAGGSQAMINEISSTNAQSTGLSAKARSDLGLPPP